MKYPHVSQHDEKDCGAACLSMIAEYYGLKLPLARFRSLIKMDNFGANIYGIVTGANEIGLHADALMGTPKDLLKSIRKQEIDFPFIARIINTEMFEHFVVIYGIENGKVLLGDPAKEQITRVPWDEFALQWQQQIITFAKDKTFVEANERKGTFKKFFKWIFNQKRLLVLILVVSLIISAVNIFSAFVFEYVIDDAIAVGDVDGAFSKEMHEHMEEEKDEAESFLTKVEEKLSIIFKNLETVCVSVILLYLVRSALHVWRGYMLAVISKNVDIPITMGYYDHLVDLPADFFATKKTGELLSRFGDASKIRDAISTATLTVMLDTLMAIVTGCYLLFLNGKLFLITLGVMTIYASIMICFLKPIKHTNRELMEGNAQINSYLKESLDGIETVKAYQYESFSKARTRSLFSAFSNRIVHTRVIYSLQEGLTGLAQSIGVVILLWLGAYLCIGNVITVGVLITYYYLLDYFLDPIKHLVELQPILQTAIVAAERLNDILDVPVEDNVKKESVPSTGDIAFNHVDFRYGNRELVLKNVNLSIRCGEKIAIVGESGSGKTTLAKLLLRFYEPESGEVTLDGRNINDYSLNSLREGIAYVCQNTFLFSDTIRNNLALGNPNLTEDEMNRVCELSKIADFIHDLPLGYDTPLDENGMNLSGGQRQRLAIARALARHPQLLILDEATSNLDIVTENGIRDTIFNLDRTMTCIIIAHRLTTIRSCDRIYVMKKGIVAETGTYEELMEKQGEFYRLWNAM